MAGAEDMADRAYIRLGHRSENQAILFLCVYPPFTGSFRLSFSFS